MSESIVLPRSGIVVHVELAGSDGVWDVRLPHENILLSYSRCREKAIEDADKEALALRAALLPPDAVERVANAILKNERDEPRRYWTDHMGRDRCETDESHAERKARAVLAALGVER